MRRVLQLVGVGCLLVGSACSAQSGGTLSVNGSELEGEIIRQFRAADGGTPLSDASCPNKRLVEGDSIVCRVTFQDGSFRDFALTVERAADGQVAVEIDLAD